MYRDAVNLIVKHDLRERFRDRSRRLASRSHGYGFSDDVGFLHDDAFEDAGDLDDSAED